jgi:NADPH2:quinone reductase
VNPLTSFAFLEFMQKGKHKACVLSAAVSSVGKMIYRMLTLKGYDVICVVRRDDQAESAKTMGAKHILNSEHPNFEKDLKTLASKLKATCYFDAIGGDLMWTIFKNMPAFSECHMFGHLSNKPTNKVDASHLIFTNKVIKGFYLGIWIRQKSLYDRLWMSAFMKREISGIMKTDVVKCFPLEKANEAIKFYTENMSLGKVIIRPSL